MTNASFIGRIPVAALAVSAALGLSACGGSSKAGEGNGLFTPGSSAPARSSPTPSSIHSTIVKLAACMKANGLHVQPSDFSIKGAVLTIKRTSPRTQSVVHKCLGRP